MTQSKRKRWQVVVVVGIMLAALFGYLSTLDDSDPQALPEAADALDPAGD